MPSFKMDDLESESGEEETQMETDEEEEKKVDLDALAGEMKKPKVSKPGIIYLSTIPPKMNVRQIREYFENYGEINRSFMQPDTSKPWKGKGRPKNQIFTEGWIEFRKRRHAKKVAKMLNSCPVGGKKSKEYHDHLWNIKYLSGFQWVHLNERLAYERISKKAKVRTEISAAKRESSFFAKNVELSKRLKKKGVLTKSGVPTNRASNSTAEGVKKSS